MSRDVSRPEVTGDSIDGAMQRNDALHNLAIALASNGITYADGSLIDTAPILRDLEEQGYTLRLTTHAERLARNLRRGEPT